MTIFFNRMLRAAKLDSSLYEEVESDTSALLPAMFVVLLSSLAAGIGTLPVNGSCRYILWNSHSTFRMVRMVFFNLFHRHKNFTRTTNRSRYWTAAPYYRFFQLTWHFENIRVNSYIRNTCIRYFSNMDADCNGYSSTSGARLHQYCTSGNGMYIRMDRTGNYRVTTFFNFSLAGGVYG